MVSINPSRLMSSTEWKSSIPSQSVGATGVLLKYCSPSQQALQGLQNHLFLYVVISYLRVSDVVLGAKHTLCKNFSEMNTAAWDLIVKV